MELKATWRMRTLKSDRINLLSWRTPSGAGKDVEFVEDEEEERWWGW